MAIMHDCEHKILKCMSCMRQGDLYFFIDEANAQQVDANDVPSHEIPHMHMEDEFDARSEQIQDEIERDWKLPSLGKITSRFSIR